MTTARREFAGRLAVESFVIIASILAAFALDTWWDTRQEREEEQETLAALQVEFQAARESIEWYGTLQVRILDNVLLVRDGIEEAMGRGHRTATLPDSALGLAYIPPTLSLSLGTLEGLVASGRLGIIQDRALRTALGGWGTGLSELAEEERDLRTLVNTDMDPVLRARMSTVGLWEAGNHLAASEPEPVTGVRQVPADSEILGVMQLRGTILTHTVTEYDNLMAEVDTILSLIDRSLDR